MIKGSVVALITPFLENKAIDYRKIYELIEFQHFNQTDGLLILGTTSECATLNDYEKDQLVEFVIKQNAKRMKIIVGVMTNVTDVAITKAIKYEALGADALLLIPPFYNKTNNLGLINHFKQIAYSVKIPVILYNIPSRVGLNMNFNILKELKEIPNIIGVKESNSDITHLLDTIKIYDDKFYLYGGNDELSYLFLALGATGLINVYGNLEPIVIKNLINIYDENPLLAKNYFLEYLELFKILNLEVNPIPIKALMNYVGMNVGLYRSPLEVMDENNFKKMMLEYIKMK